MNIYDMVMLESNGWLKDRDGLSQPDDPMGRWNQLDMLKIRYQRLSEMVTILYHYNHHANVQREGLFVISIEKAELQIVSRKTCLWALRKVFYNTESILSFAKSQKSEHLKNMAAQQLQTTELDHTLRSSPLWAPTPNLMCLQYIYTKIICWAR